MKIVQLDIQGFRSLKNVSWRPGDLNVIIGPNGSGKSNLLRMLELISAAAQGRLSRFVQAEGGMGAIVWDGSNQSIAFHMISSSLGVPFSQENNLYTVSLLRQAIAGYLIQYEVLGPSFVLSYPDKVSDAMKHIERKEDEAKIFNDNQLQMEVPNGAFQDEEAILSLAANPFSGNAMIQAYQKQLEAWSIYQGFRTDQYAPIRQAPVSRLEQRVAPDSQNLINVLHTLYTNNRQFEQDINDAMSAAFGSDYDKLIFPPDSGDQRVQMRVRWKTLKRDQSTADLSDGTLRFLFLLTVLASPNPPPLIAIDEPETGLHPSMLPIVAEYAVEAASRSQVIFTTHSDSFLSAFQDTKPTTTVARWENGETILKTISGETLDYWLQEYSLGSLFRSGELEEME